MASVGIYQAYLNCSEATMDKTALAEIITRSWMAESVSVKVVQSLFDHITEQEEKIVKLGELGGFCIECLEPNDSRESKDICESCDMQNRMDKIKREYDG